MLNMFKKAFWVPYDDGDIYPTESIATDAIARYCGSCNWSYRFTDKDEVEIEGKLYTIYRGYQNGSRGNYGIKCREK